MRGKGEGSIFKDSRGYWTAVIELPSDGRTRRRKTIRDRDKRALMVKLDAAKQQMRRTGDLRTAGITVEDWFAYWLTAYAEPNVRPKTVASYRSVIKNQIIPSLGAKTKLEKVTASSVQRLRSDILESGRSSTYARNAHHVLAKSLTHAAGEGRIPSVPTEFVEPPRRARTDLDVLDLAEAITLLEAIKDRPDRARWAMSLLTGARRGEVIGLEVDRVTDVLDLSWQLQRLPHVDGKPIAPEDFEYRQVRGGLYLTRPKSQAGWRVIPLVNPLRATIENHLARNPSNEWGLVFTDERGNPRDPDYDTREWRTLMQSVFGEERRVRLHDLRHAAVDLLYEAGVPEDLITEIVGHSTRTMTRAYKSRGNRQRLLAAMTAFGELFTQSEQARTREIGGSSPLAQ